MARFRTSVGPGSRHRRSRLLAALLAAGLLVALALPSAAQDTPSLAVSPDEGAPATSVRLTGEGWFRSSVEPGEPEGPVAPEEITVTFRREPWTPTLAVSENGSLTGEGVIPEGSFGGVAPIEMCAEGVGCATAFFRVTPAIAVSQDAGRPGTTFDVTGSGFEPVDPPRQWDVRLGADEEPIGVAFVGSEGTLEGRGTVPLDASEGETSIAVCQFDIDSGDVCYLTPFEVTAPDITVDPTDVRPGDSLTFSGVGWCCDGSRGVVYAATPDEPWGEVTVDQSGNLAGEAVVPLAQPPGAVDLTVCITERCRQLTITVLAAPSTTTVSTVTSTTTTTVPTTTTTVGPVTACEVVPGSLTVDPQSGVAGTPIDVSLTTAPEGPEVCHLGLSLGGEAVGPPFDVERGSAVTVAGVVPAGIAAGRSTLEVIDTSTGGVAGAIGFDIEGDGLPVELVLAGIILLLLIGGVILLIRLWPGPPADGPAPPPIPTTGELWPALRMPANVEAGQPFRGDLVLTTVDQNALPATDLDVEMIADGYETATTRHRLNGGGEKRISVAVDLTARPVAEPSPHRIVAHIYSGGHLVGWAQAEPTVFPAGTPQLQAGTAPAAAVALGDPDGRPPDLTVTITRGDDERYLVWGLGSPHPVTLPGVKIRSDLGKDNARAFAHDEVLGLATTDPELVGMQLGGVAAQIGGRIPAAVWQAMSEVAPYAAAQGRPPVILLVSEETYVPWELAAVPDVLVIDQAAPKVLGAQMVIGRWMPPDAADGLHPDHPRLPPSAQLEVQAITVVLHGEEAGASSPLPFAIEEAETLKTAYAAVTIPAATAPVAALLELRGVAGTEPARPDIVHLACHGKVDPAHPSRSGIVLRTAQGAWVPVTAAMLRGSALLPAVRPLVFINACSTGTPQEALDGFGGLVGAALKSGARGVVAPLWEVVDRPARDAALTVYSSALGSGAAMGDALRRVRAKATEPERLERSFLAYVYFGNPWLRLTTASLLSPSPSAHAVGQPG